MRIHIDLAGAKAYVATEHARTNVAKNHTDDPYKLRFVGKTDARILGEYLQHHVREDDNDPSVGWVDVTYEHCRIGKRLVTAGS